MSLLLRFLVLKVCRFCNHVCVSYIQVFILNIKISKIFSEIKRFLLYSVILYPSFTVMCFVSQIFTRIPSIRRGSYPAICCQRFSLQVYSSSNSNPTHGTSSSNGNIYETFLFWEPRGIIKYWWMATGHWVYKIWSIQRVVDFRHGPRPWLDSLRINCSVAIPRWQWFIGLGEHESVFSSWIFKFAM